MFDKMPERDLELLKPIIVRTESAIPEKGLALGLFKTMEALD